jgi:hypothetical protein
MFVMCLLLRPDVVTLRRRNIDVAGAPLAGSALLLGLFVATERRSANPLLLRPRRS